MWTTWLLLALAVTVQGRAVNISNTWVLPEEGFPVFYRYFRDRISWYEADAVCQFHHANLVTVDTTAQYDAVRAYLKELDISSAVWVGLIRSNPDGDFTWTDYRGLSGEGYWSSAPDSRTAPLCAAADPAADYRWDARACGGPSVASFICELPVPQWALGSEGCMLKALPALTVLYLPESAAVQLTTDCGLAGVRRVQCTGNVKREDLLKDLSCSEDVSTTLWNVHFTGNDMETTTGFVFDGDSETDENIMTDQQEVQQSTVKSSTTQTFNLVTQNVLAKQNQQNSMFDKVPDLNIIENNNIYNNLPTGPYKTDFSSTEYANKLEDERHMHHKLLHDELARLGNFESIFNQATDHFVPPLVMAKAKLSNDMNAMSFEEKLAQEHEDYEELSKHSNDMKLINKNNVATTQVPQHKTTHNFIINTQDLIHENKDKEITKKVVPKKYFSKQTKPLDVKRKSLPILNLKVSLDDEINITPTSSITTLNKTVITPKYDVQNKTDNDEKDETSIELTVIIREPSTNLKDIEYNLSNGTDMITKYSHEVLNSSVTYNDLSEHTVVITKPNSTIVGNVEIIQEINSLNDSIVESITSTTDTTHHSYEVFSTSKPYTNDFNHAVVQTTKIDIVSGESMHVVKSKHSQIFDLEKSTSQPIFKDDLEKNNVTTESFLDIHSNITYIDSNTSNVLTNQTNHMYTNNMINSSPVSNVTENNDNINNSSQNNDPLVSEVFVINVTQDEIPNIIINGNITEIIEHPENLDSNIELHLSSNSSEEEIDDFQSPLLSGADDSEIHKPMRTRRIQIVQNRGKKFNPFRILG
ncbi:protein PF14_0175 [Pieris brassicae]|uniref:protein PF14_0175 n=1 Tax=Pieris brassicae TaxID=7116 RepID=UPI001E65F081|nr:protein PF14_0175 [Pieris brassicae]